jgi:hypothetical protein
MRSIYHTNKGELNLHFHIYNINNDILTDIKKYANRFPELNISCTSEVVAQDENKTAYASKRFIFAEHALKLLSTPVLIVDADSLIRKPWKEISNWVEDNDLLVNKPEVSPFWESIIGGFVWLGGKEQSTSYIKKVSLFCAATLLRQLPMVYRPGRIKCRDARNGKNSQFAAFLLSGF